MGLSDKAGEVLALFAGVKGEHMHVGHACGNVAHYVLRGSESDSLTHEEGLRQLLNFTPTRMRDERTGSYNMYLRALAGMRRLGFAFAGYGHFSSVFTHPMYPGEVLKLSMRKDDAYKAFAMHARAAHSEGLGQHLPDVRHIEQRGDTVVYVLKEYKPIHAVLPEFCGYDLVERSATHRSNSLYRRSLCSAVRKLMKFFKGVAVLDLHSENVMYDPEFREVIITDPVSFTHNKENQDVAEPIQQTD